MPIKQRAHHRKFVTKVEHYPERHQAYLEVTPRFLLDKSAAIGPECGKLMTELLNEHHPLRHLRRGLGIVGLERKYGKAALEKACVDANRFNVRTYQWISGQLKRMTKLTDYQLKTQSFTPKRGSNPYLRGADLFSSLKPATQPEMKEETNNECRTNEADFKRDEALWDLAEPRPKGQRIH
jgi:hypothetical protein